MDTFKFDKSWMEAIVGLPNDIRLEVYDSIVAYAFGGDIGGLKPVARMAFNFIKPEIDKQIKNYEAVCERNRRNGSKGGRPLKNPVGFSELVENKQVENIKEDYKNPNNPVGFLGFSGFSQEEEKEEKEKESPITPIKKKEEEKEEEKNPQTPKGASTQNRSIIEIPDYVSEEYRNILSEWLRYKRSSGKGYKTDIGIKKLYTRLLNLSNNDPKKAAAIVDQSIASNWDGLFALKDSFQPTLTDEGIDWEKMASRFNRLGIIKIKDLDIERKQMFLRVRQEYGEGFTSMLIEVYKKIEKCNYLKGFNKSGWVANYDFVFTKVNFRKIFEGFYDNMK